MSDENNTMFRKKVVDRISSPDQLTDYLKVTDPGIWAVLLAVILLMAGLAVWSAVGTLETKADAKIIVEKHRAEVVITGPEQIREGMKLRVGSEEAVIASTKEDSYGRITGVAEISLPDGSYNGIVVVDETKPISFLLESR